MIIRENNIGENHGQAKSTIEKVINIKLRLANGEKGSVIARDLGINPKMVSSIKIGKTWTHVDIDSILINN